MSGRSGPAVSRAAGLLAGLLALGLALVSPVAAQQPPMAKDLEFPSAPVQLSEFSVPEMVLLKPDGPGPFPALVLHHQCGGLRRGQWHNQSMRDWAVKAVNRGYVVLLINSLGPRNVDWVCGGPRGRRQSGTRRARCAAGRQPLAQIPVRRCRAHSPRRLFMGRHGGVAGQQQIVSLLHGELGELCRLRFILSRLLYREASRRKPAWTSSGATSTAGISS